MDSNLFTYPGKVLNINLQLFSFLYDIEIFCIQDFLAAAITLSQYHNFSFFISLSPVLWFSLYISSLAIKIESINAQYENLKKNYKLILKCKNQ